MEILQGFFPIINLCIYYNWKRSYFYLDTLFLLCSFKFHRTVLQLTVQNLYTLKTTITRAIWKIILQARTDKNSLFCRLWESQTLTVVPAGEGVCDNKRQIILIDISYAVKTWGWLVLLFVFFNKNVKIDMHKFLLLCNCHLHLQIQSDLEFFYLVPNQIRNTVIYLWTK